MARLTACAILLAGCPSTPAALISFEPFDPDDPRHPEADACLVEEARWFEGLALVWFAAETDAEVLAHRCVGAEDVSGWDALEARLSDRGDLLTDLPVGSPFHLYLVANKFDECPGEDGPLGADLGFCAYSVDPVQLDADKTASAELARYCQGAMTTRGCYDVAEMDRSRRGAR